MRRKILVAVVIFLLVILPVTGIGIDTRPGEDEDELSDGDGTRGPLDDPVQIDRLAARWHFNEGKDSEIKDASRNGNHGQLKTGGVGSVNQNWVTGISGSAVNLDGINDYIEVPDSQSLDISRAITIEGWVKPVGFNAFQSIVNKPGGEYCYELRVEWQGALSLIIKGAMLSSRSNIRIGEWSYVAATYNGSMMTLYINGIKDAEKVHSGDLHTDDTVLYIGSSSSSDGFFKGALDEMSIHQRALSSEEIWNNYLLYADLHTEMDEYGGSWLDDFGDDSGVDKGIGGAPVADEHTTGLWHLDEGGGNEVKDGSGNGNGGSLVNMGSASWIGGRFGKALVFDNTDDYVDCGNDNSLAGRDEITIEAWIHPKGWGESGPSGYGRIVTKVVYQVLLIGGSERCLAINLKTGGVIHTIQTSRDSIELNKWYHITVTYDSNEVLAYINGENQTLRFANQKPSGNLDTHRNDNLLIGNQEYQAATFDGIIDEVRISNTIRTPKEIKNIYEGKLGIQSGKVEPNSWRFQRTITVVNNGNELSDFPLELNLNKDDFDYSHSAKDGRDVRFLDRNGVKLNHWIEEWNSSGDSKVWVNVTSVPNGNSEITMRYGNPRAQSESDGRSVFMFYDDFEDGTMDYWEKHTHSGGSLSVVTGGGGVGHWVKLSSGSDWWSAGIALNYTSRQDFVVEARYLSKSNSYGQGGHDTFGFNLYFYDPLRPRGATYGDPNYPRIGFRYDSTDGSYVITQKDLAKNNNGDRQGSGVQRSTWYDFKAVLSPTLRLYQGGEEKIHYPRDAQTWSDIGANMSIEWSHADYAGPANYAGIDNVRVYRYVSNTPTSSLGDENVNPSPTLMSVPVHLPYGYDWSSLSVHKSEPGNSVIYVSVLDANDNSTLPGFANLSSRFMDLSNLNDLDVTSIRLKAYFLGSGRNDPSLDRWGVEWTADNAWRDSYVGDSKVAYPYGVDEHTVGYWRFDEGTGNGAKDSSGKGNNGTLHRMDDDPWVDGIRGTAVRFDGNNDHVDCGDAPSLQIGDELTVSAWVRPEIVSHGKIYQESDESHSPTLGLSYGDDGRFSFDRHTGSWQGTTASKSSAIDEWHHVAGVFDGEWMRLYVDGREEGRLQAPGTLSSTAGRNVIGLDSRLDRKGFNGTIDEVCISSIARTKEEIIEAFKAGIAIGKGRAQLTDNDVSSDENCAGLWQFNEWNDGNTLDSSGTENHGTVHGAEWTDSAMSGALEFKGDGGHVNCGNDESLDFSGEMTLSAWIYPEDLDRAQAIVSKANYTAVQGYYMALRNTGDITFRQMGMTPANIISRTRIRSGEWTHIAISSGSNARRIYINGKPDNAGIMGGSVDPCPLDFTIGKLSWLEQDYFKGMMDDVAVFDRILNESEVRALSSMHVHNSTLRSEAITVPRDHSWSTFHFNRTVPKGTYLNISVRNSVTDEILLSDDNDTGDAYHNLSHIDPTKHPSIYLEGHVQSHRTATPVLFDWAVNWTWTEPVFPPNLTQSISDITFDEDTNLENAFNLSNHFQDTNHPPLPLSYEVVGNTADGKIIAELNGSFISFFSPNTNWTGSGSFSVNCTNELGLLTRSNNFTVTVAQVNDRPAWTSSPEGLFITRGVPFVSAYSLGDLVEDAENDSLDFEASCEHLKNLSIGEDGHISINLSASGGFTGDTVIDLKVYETDNRSSYTNITIPATVSDYPRPLVTLLGPENGAVITDRSVTLRWNCTDPDSAPEEVLFDLYFGNTSEPPKFISDLAVRSQEVPELDDNTTYYWKVVARDETDYGLTASGIWNFSVNTAAVVPEVVLETPLNGTTINTTHANLTWSLLNASGGGIAYRVLVGGSPDTLTERGVARETWYYLQNLSDNTTYHWRIEPYLGGLKGYCVSGTWSFHVKEDFVERLNVTLDWDGKPLGAVKGHELSFNLTIRNDGNVALSIGLDKEDTSPLKNRISLGKNSFVLLPGDHIIVPITLFTSQIGVGNHAIVLLLSYRTYEHRVEIPVNITSGKEGPEDPDTMDDGVRSYLIYIIIAAVVALGIIVALVLIIRKRRSKDDEQEEFEFEEIEADADIVHVPTFGQTAQPQSGEPGATTDTMPQRDMRYSFKGRTEGGPGTAFPASPAQPMPPMPPSQPVTTGTAGSTGTIDTTGATDASGSGIDLSGLHIPEGIVPPGITGEGEKILALPPARLLEVTEEEQKVPIDELFLMTSSGLLVQHYSLQRESGLNEDVLASMLTAVKSFIIDSLSMVEVEGVEDKDLSIDMGAFSVMMASGKSMNLVAITDRTKKELVRGQLEKGLEALERNFGSVMENWDGDMSKVAGVQPFVVSLVKGELDESKLLEHEAPAPQPAAPLPGPPVSPGTGPELPSGMKAVTIALPDPIKVPDTTRALPEKSEVSPEAPPGQPGGVDILAALDDILIDIPSSPGVPDVPPGLATSGPATTPAAAPTVAPLPPPATGTAPPLDSGGAGTAQALPSGPGKAPDVGPAAPPDDGKEPPPPPV